MTAPSLLHLEREMAELQGLTWQELADVLGKRYWTARLTLDYCRRQVAEIMEERKAHYDLTGKHSGMRGDELRQYRDLCKRWETVLIRAGGVAGQHQVDVEKSRWRDAELNVRDVVGVRARRGDYKPSAY